MEYLHTCLFLVLLSYSTWPSVGKTYFTHLGTKCTSDCSFDDDYYKCWTNRTGYEEKLYCSPKEHFDYQNKKCKGICEKFGADYYWCKTGWFSWGYCGMVMEEKTHYGSKTGLRCKDHCERTDKGYFSCTTAQGLDHCSPSKNRDYKNSQCQEDSPCGKYNHHYNWCKLKEGHASYCGLVEAKSVLHRSIYHYTCIDECRYDESYHYYWCHTANGWDKCSPDVDVTYKGKPCRSDHPCDLHGESYNWCFTSVSDYDYCGPIESRHRDRRDLEDRTLACTLEDKGQPIISNFTVVPAPDDITDGSQWRNETETLIRRWDNRYLVDMARANLIHSDHLRIDIQGTITRKKQLYYNLQVNVRRRPGTTVSQIIVSRGIPECYIRRAFMESFRNRARVYVDEIY
ncbi:uncharacterized protein LOC120486092 [Pimephales promelas]|uniref:uncharacterized protein LOC120486092 n=1 Tax=Pimephales promelas TaxID=90988 RepID=UPI001955975C|nr:uncharacterized protein LOC120486092 [Pimephales promelas]